MYLFESHTLEESRHEPEYCNWSSRRRCDHHLGGDVPNARDERHSDRNGNAAGNHHGADYDSVYDDAAVDNYSVHYGADYDRTIDHHTINDSVHYRAIDNDAVDDNTGAITKAAARSCKKESGRTIAMSRDKARHDNRNNPKWLCLSLFPATLDFSRMAECKS
ncbi:MULTISPECIES: hypothetical protein [unclassified Ensifer]|uniref:hypothetical protein n=1 Tax=unclassified Ensifer TaxID=2633371 RepID=UPI000813772A|nr:MULTISPECIES: hypothetical protein [unclassified Ensifer]OCP21409.1 hypothetical protein BC361_26435 [Ensifer sp. LC54]OCP26856.1 hypothetical protein BC363_16140 [Ensifer sp. LC384]